MNDTILLYINVPATFDNTFGCQTLCIIGITATATRNAHFFSLNMKYFSKPKCEKKKKKIFFQIKKNVYHNFNSRTKNKTHFQTLVHFVCVCEIACCCSLFFPTVLRVSKGKSLLFFYTQIKNTFR